MGMLVGFQQGIPDLRGATLHPPPPEADRKFSFPSSLASFKTKVIFLR